MKRTDGIKKHLKGKSHANTKESSVRNHSTPSLFKAFRVQRMILAEAALGSLNPKEICPNPVGSRSEIPGQI